jgi:membrane protease YdiL (CAAX protease family)
MNTNQEQDMLKTAGVDWAIVAFFGLAYLIAWGMIPILSAIARQSGVENWAVLSQMGETFSFDEISLAVPGWIVYLITRVQDFAFTIAGVLMIALLQGRGGLVALGQRLLKWRVKWTWYLLAFLPFGLYFIATILAGALSSFQFDLKGLAISLISIESGFLVTLFLRGPMGEEPGLRGFALPRLQSYMTPFKASLIIGLLWGAWHLPVLLQRDVVSIVAFLLLAFGLSFMFTFLFNRSEGSLIPVLLFHATQNSEEFFETFFPALVGSDWELISTLSLLVIGLVFGIIVWRSRD